MSLVTLHTSTPRDFFRDHKLVFHVARTEMDKVRVFHDKGKWSLAALLGSLSIIRG